MLSFQKPAEADCVCEIVLQIPTMWRPCDIMNSEDTRSLGIDLILSDISIIKA